MRGRRPYRGSRLGIWSSTSESLMVSRGETCRLRGRLVGSEISRND